MFSVKAQTSRRGSDVCFRRDPPPQSVNDQAAGDHRQKITEIPRRNPPEPGDLAKYQLGIGKLGREIKHRQFTISGKDKVQDFRDPRKSCEQSEHFHRAPNIILHRCAGSAQNADNDQQIVPQKPEQRQKHIPAHHIGWIKIYGNSAQQCIICQKCDNRFSPFFKQWQKQAEIHRHAAQLKREVPPVIDALIHDQKAEQLLENFPACQQNAESMNNSFCLRLSIIPRSRHAPSANTTATPIIAA